MFSGNRKFFTIFLQQDFLVVFKTFSDLTAEIRKPGKPIFTGFPGNIEKIDATGFEPAFSAPLRSAQSRGPPDLVGPLRPNFAFAPAEAVGLIPSF